MSAPLPSPVADYLGEVVERTLGVLADATIGVYLSGSAAVGEYVEGRSDLDVFAVSRTDVALDDRLALVGALRHEELLCPARRLEFVVYAEHAVRIATPAAAFELNLNTGRDLEETHVSLDPAEEPRHWFVLDRAFVRDHGRALFGPPPAEVFTRLDAMWVTSALGESVAWFRNEPTAPLDDAVLAGCRAWRWVDERTLSGKLAAGEWALGREGDDELVRTALTARRGAAGDELDRGRVIAFLDLVSARMALAT